MAKKNEKSSQNGKSTKKVVPVFPKKSGFNFFTGKSDSVSGKKRNNGFFNN